MVIFAPCMINYLSHNKFLNICWALLAFFMLNISIDMVDATPPNTAEDLTYNEQESIIEFILEEMIGIEDAIPETEDNDASQKTVLKKTSNIDQFTFNTVLIKEHDYGIVKIKYPQQRVVAASTQFIKVVSPPPEV